MKEDLAYCIGLICGDGCLLKDKNTGAYYISIADKSLKFHKEVISPLFEKLFGIKPKVSKLKTRWKNITYRTRLWSKKAFELFKKMGVLEGKEKTYFMKTPSWILNGNRRIKIAYLRGWMDAEGCITRRIIKRKTRSYVYPRIAFQVVNKNIRDELSSILKTLGIRNYKWDSNKMHGLEIIGFENVKRYYKIVGFRHPNKLLPIWSQTWTTMHGTMRCHPERGS